LLLKKEKASLKNRLEIRIVLERLLSLFNLQVHREGQKKEGLIGDRTVLQTGRVGKKKSVFLY
jgi:hypothetical protein